MALLTRASDMLTTPSQEAIPRQAGNVLLWVVTLGAGLGGALATGAPTGIGWWDAVLRFGLAALVALAASRARRWTWLLLAGVGATFAAGLPWALISGIGVAIAFVSVFAERRDYLFGGLAGGLGMQGVLRMDGIGFFGLQTIIATLVIVPVLVLGYRYSRRHIRRYARWAGFGVFSFLLLGGLITAVGVVTARADVDRGVSSARGGLAAARDGNSDLAVSRLADAETSLDKAHDRIGAFWMQPGRLIPIVGQHLTAARTATEQGADVAAQAGLAAVQADTDRLRAVGGSINLDEVETMQAPLNSLVQTLGTARAEVAEARSPWLISFVDDEMLELIREIDTAQPDAVLAAQAVDVLPALLGAEAPRTYLAIFSNPGETRELGGIIGSFVEFSIDDGRVSILRSGKNQELGLEAGQPGLSDSSTFPDEFRSNEPEQFVQNWTGMPDFPAVADAVMELYPQMGGSSIDGVFYLDPAGIAALLALTGPITTEYGQFSAQNVEQFLLLDQYRQFPEFGVRGDALEQIARLAFDELADAELPGPKRLGEILGQAGREGHLAFSTGSASERDFLREVDFLGEFPEADGNDFVSLLQVSGEPNKLDNFIQKNWTYDVALDTDTGAFTGTVTLELISNVEPATTPDYVLGLGLEEFDRNFVPPEPLGRHTVQLSLFTPHPLGAMAVDGIERDVRERREFDLFRYIEFVTIVPGDTRVVSYEIAGVLPVDDRQYVLTLAAQPTVNTDNVTVNVRSTNGVSLTSVAAFEDTANGVRATLAPTTDTTLVASW